MNYIQMVGAEMEGFWPENHGLDLSNDVSVHCLDYDRDKIERLNLIDGEAQSPPESDLSRLKNWIKQYFPHHTNGTCGYHIHVSLKRPEYRAALVNKRFHKTFLTELEKWALKKKIRPEFKQRLLRGNTYCLRGFQTSEKYRAINFSHSSGTIEFRIFSMCMNRRMAQSCVEFVKNQVEKFLEKEKSIGEQKFKMIRYTKSLPVES